MQINSIPKSNSDSILGTTIVPYKRLTIGIVLLRALYYLFCFAFTVIVGSVIFANSANDFSAAILLALIVLNLALLFFAFHMLKKHATFVERYYKCIIASGLVFLFVVNVISGYALRYEPVFDLGAIFTGASEWVSTGNFMDHMNWTCDPSYFYYFPNNLGGMTLLFFGFKFASWFSIADYYAVAMVMNALLGAATVLLTVLICKRLLGMTQSVMALVCVLMSPPFYFLAPVFYTDALSMVFPVLTIFLYLKYTDCEACRIKVLWATLIGACCAVGMLVKITVVIALIAVLIYHICTKGVTSALPVVAVSGVVIAAVLIAFNAYFYSAHLDKSTAEKLNVPYIHWIMMSLEGEGKYNPQDYEFTFSFDDPEEKKTAISSLILQRIKSRGLRGMLDLFYAKGITIFGDGTYAQSDFLDDNPVNETALHRFVLYDGEFYPEYKHLCSGIYFTLQLLMLVSAYGALRKKEAPSGKTLPLLSMLGIMLFLMFWEVSGRYLTNFIPMIIISAVSGLDVLSRDVSLTEDNLTAQAQLTDRNITRT
ncbi:MAG TPA: glycosyltransferase family 39 protein [Clostridia bacterium]|nr:glycosyltransferase family 39 protein [Clostridia bacterium]